MVTKKNLQYYARSDVANAANTLPLRPKSWTAANNSLKAIWGREVTSIDTLTAAGPPRDNPRPSGTAHRDPYQAYALSARPLDGS